MDEMITDFRTVGQLTFSVFFFYLYLSSRNYLTRCKMLEGDVTYTLRGIFLWFIILFRALSNGIVIRV